MDFIFLSQFKHYRTYCRYVLTLPIKCDALLFWIVSRWSVLLRLLLTQVTPPDIQTAELSPRTSSSDIGHQYWHYGGSHQPARGLDITIKWCEIRVWWCSVRECDWMIKLAISSLWSSLIIHWPWPLSSAPPIRIYVESALHIYLLYLDMKNWRIRIEILY